MSLRDELHAFADRIADAIEKTSTGDDWVDQKRSPLGREKHLALVKSGVLPAVKEGRQVLVRRSHLDAYLATKTVVKVNEALEEEREVARVLASIGQGRRA